MSIGWVMFGKSVAMAIVLAIGAWWKSFRAKRKARGLPMRQNRQGVYVVFDWANYVERFAVRLWNGLLDFLIIMTICLMTYYWILS